MLNSDLTHSQRKALPFEARDAVEFALFLEEKTRTLPASFAAEVAREWTRRRKLDAIESARWGFGTLRAIRQAQGLGVVHSDTDGELCRKAETEARLMAGLLDAVAVRVRKLKGATRPAEWVARLIVRAQAWAVRMDLRRRGIEHKMPQGKYIRPQGVVSRARDPIFWRRILRGLHAVMLEGTAIGLGLVRAGRKDGCYVSGESLKRRRGQRARNAAALSSTMAMNERGEADTLADIAAKGMSNGNVRRSELMTRISGFEVIATHLGHAASFVTLTCPSRMHKWRKGTGLGTLNPSYDGTLPDAAQRYLAKQWQRFRSAAARADLGLYGFRIVEPHHDGCPHWHMLLWHEDTLKKDRSSDARVLLRMLLERYFLFNDSPNERGATDYRVKVDAIDPDKGSAVAYVAKYIAKNVDGLHITHDLFGNPAIEAAERVEAWASTWRIRQFQQIGGAPVGVWRELRRVHPGAAPMEAGQALHDALMMASASGVDVIMGGPGSEVGVDARMREGWAAYVKAQGGPMAKRVQHALRVLREQRGVANRYGETGAPVVAGITAAAVEAFNLGIVRMKRLRVDEVESERSMWVTATFKRGEGASKGRVVERMQATLAEQQDTVNRMRAQRILRRHVHRGEALGRGEAAAPWTRVNNCTRQKLPHEMTLAELQAPQVHRTPKRGQVFRWPGREGPPKG